jgi:glycosyltransferase involved in cell wall biosynthesis
MKKAPGSIKGGIEMKICYDARVVLNRKTGVSRYAWQLIEHLLKIDRENEWVVLVNPALVEHHPLWQLRRYPNVQIRLMRTPRMGIAHYLWFLFAQTSIDADVYHYPHFDLPFLWKSVKQIVTIHDLQYVKYPDFFVGLSRLKSVYTRIATKLALLRADRVISVSKTTAKDIQRIYKYPESRISVIYEGVDPTFLKHYDSAEILQTLSRYRITRPYFLFVGQQRPHKNLPTLIKSFSKVVANLPNHALVIIGSGYKGYKEPQEMVARLGLQDRVRFIEYVSDEELAHFYSAATSLVYPSLYEGFGLPLLEAMACGTPVITSNVAAMAEIAGENAILVEPTNVDQLAEALLSVATDQRLRSSLIEKGLQHSRKFTWEQAAHQTLEIYRQD